MLATVRSESSAVSLREVTAETVRAVCQLKVTPEQERFVANNAFSIAQAHFSQEAWFRAIYAGESPIGFVMVADRPREGICYLWRFMLAAEHQRKGHGEQAMRLILARARSLPGVRAMTLSYVPGPGCPAPFYARLGFAETGELEEDERVMRLSW